MARELSTPLEEMLARELLRTRFVWNNFIHNLSQGRYPERVPGTGDNEPFKGSDEDCLFQIFKVMDFEVRHLGSVLNEMGVETGLDPSVEMDIFDQVSNATGITTKTHK
ncbi:MAG: hypothetical protein AAB582_03295 [Patescibacteria group bacterium]